MRRRRKSTGKAMARLRDYLKLLRHALSGAKKGGSVPQAGEPAPPFAVPDESGRVRTLAEFRGKTLVLWFYPKADTPG
jgi:hypothetical protein